MVKTCTKISRIKFCVYFNFSDGTKTPQKGWEGIQIKITNNFEGWCFVWLDSCGVVSEANKIFLLNVACRLSKVETTLRVLKIERRQVHISRVRTTFPFSLSLSLYLSVMAHKHTTLLLNGLVHIWSLSENTVTLRITWITQVSVFFIS